MRKILLAAVAAFTWHTSAFAEDKPKSFPAYELSSAIPQYEDCRGILALTHDTYEVAKGGVVSYHGHPVYDWSTRHRLYVVRVPNDSLQPEYCIAYALQMLSGWEVEQRIKQSLGLGPRR